MTLSRNLSTLGQAVTSDGKLPTANLSGSIANTSITGTFPSSSITGLAASATTDTTNASNITTGTLPSAVYTSGATGVPVLNVYTSSSTWTKPATVKAIKVTVVGGGGSGGTSGPPTAPTAAGGGSGGGGGGTSIFIYPGPSLPGPQPYTVGGAGGTSSFGVAPITVISATGVAPLEVPVVLVLLDP